MKKAELPPCATCRTYTDSFLEGVKKTSRGNFAGGDTAWEEENNLSYSKSEVRLVEIQEQLCTEVVRGSDNCHHFKELHEHEVEEWWREEQDKEPDLFKWLCINQLKVCCPPNHYGPDCKPCLGGTDNPCSGNGKCKGEGTRKGNGQCDCNTGYEGDFCTICSSGFYEAFKDDSKVLCEKCHMSCDGPCSGAGPSACAKCKDGWLMDPETGCTDVDECKKSSDVCSENEYCVNTVGSFTCSKCDRACSKCLGPGPDGCINCAKGYINDEGLCIEEKNEDYGMEEEKTEL